MNCVPGAACPHCGLQGIQNYHMEPCFCPRCGKDIGVPAAQSPLLNPWVPMSKPIDLKHLGKMAEELGELQAELGKLQAILSRCLIQGIDEREPVTCVQNRVALEDEIADVYANLLLVRDHFGLDFKRMNDRAVEKADRLRQWHQMLAE